MTSLITHAAFGALVLVGVGGSAPVRGVDVGDGEMGTLEIDLASEIMPAPPPPALDRAPDVHAARAIAPRTVSAADARSTSKPTIKVPAIDPVRTLTRSHVPTPVPVTSASAAAALSTTTTLIAAAPPSPGAARALAPSAPAPRTSPIYVGADVASYLRAQDSFPALPDSLRHDGARYQARLDICVSTEGRVVNVGSHDAPPPALDSALQAAVRSWRYRPLMVDGLPAPFCHRMTVSYEFM